jgi:hypothetical protein
MRSILVFSGGLLGFAGASVAFINTRLQNAKTQQDKNKLFTNLLMAAGLIFWIVGFVLLGLLITPWVGLSVLFVSYCIQCAIFIKAKSNTTKLDTLNMIWVSVIIATTLIFTLVSKLINGLEGQLRVTESIVKVTESNTNNMKDIVEIMKKQTEAQQGAAGDRP